MIGNGNVNDRVDQFAGADTDFFNMEKPPLEILSWHHTESDAFRPFRSPCWTATYVGSILARQHAVVVRQNARVASSTSCCACISQTLLVIRQSAQTVAFA